MPLEKPKRSIFTRIFFRAIRIPLLYMIAGIICLMLSTVDDIVVQLGRFKHIFDLSDKIGNILIVLALIIFIYNFSVLVCRHFESKLKDTHKMSVLILSNIRKSLRIIFVLVAINAIISLLGPSKNYEYIINNTINTIIIGSIGWIAIQALYTFEAYIFQRMGKMSIEDNGRAKAIYTKTHILRNIGTSVIIFITMAAILMSFSSFRNIGISLLASAGFLTAIIGLSAQKTLFSLSSGLQIALAQPIRIGDTVVIDKDAGVIEEITLTYVTMKMGDRKRLIVPISYFIEKPFENWSHDAKSLRSSLVFHVGFKLPINILRAEFERIVESSAAWDGEVKKLQVADLNEKNVEIKIQISAENADKLSDLRSEIREKILDFIQRNYPEGFPKE